MTAKNNHPELIDKLTEGIANLTSSTEWQHYLDFQSRFHPYRTGAARIFEGPEWTNWTLGALTRSGGLDPGPCLGGAIRGHRSEC